MAVCRAQRIEERHNRALRLMRQHVLERGRQLLVAGFGSDKRLDGAVEVGSEDREVPVVSIEKYAYARILGYRTRDVLQDWSHLWPHQDLYCIPARVP